MLTINTVPEPAPATVRLFELTFLPDGTEVAATWAAADPGSFAKPPEGKVEGSFAIHGVPCRIDATLHDRNAILSIWADGRIVTSSLLLGSDDEARNAELTAMYLAGIRNTDLVRQLAGGSELFVDVAARTERPLLATMLLPAPSRELTDALIDVQSGWAAAVLG